MDYKLTDFLPTTKKECELRGWDELDVILFSGDAYVDHPSFGPAILGRMLEANGYRVAIVPSPTGTAISETSRNSVALASSLVFLRVPWTRW